MREIKFRVYHKPDKKRILPENSGLWLDFDGEIYHQFHGEEAPYPVDPNDFELMQYTGLKDMDGREIYEGDVVQDEGVEKPHDIAVIKYVPKLCVFLLVPIYILKLDPELEDMDVWDECVNDLCFGNWVPNKYLKVVGNVFENPELMK